MATRAAAQPATDSFTLCLPDQTFGSSGAFTENATWTYSYLKAHEMSVHLKTGSWVFRSDGHGWGGYDQDEPTRSAMLSPYMWPRVALK
eukprot:COSAG01_NODE_332_length_18712_cov_41.424358_26_plen_89_part_00